MHLAGPPVTSQAGIERQRCAWCGALLTTRNMTISDWERAPWQPGSPVTVDGERQYMEQFPPSTTPPNACWALDPEATA